jgi:hypothetical protein
MKGYQMTLLLVPWCSMTLDNPFKFLFYCYVNYFKAYFFTAMVYLYVISDMFFYGQSCSHNASSGDCTD